MRMRIQVTKMIMIILSSENFQIRFFLLHADPSTQP